MTDLCHNWCIKTHFSIIWIGIWSQVLRVAGVNSGQVTTQLQNRQIITLESNMHVFCLFVCVFLGGGGPLEESGVTTWKCPFHEWTFPMHWGDLTSTTVCPTAVYKRHCCLLPSHIPLHFSERWCRCRLYWHDISRGVVIFHIMRHVPLLRMPTKLKRATGARFFFTHHSY